MTGTSALLSGVGKVITNKIDGKPIIEGADTSMVAGGLSSFTGAYGGKKINKVVEKFTDKAIKETSNVLAKKVASSALGGAISGALASGTTTGASNLLNLGDIYKSDLKKKLLQRGCNEDQFDDLWQYFCERGAVKKWFYSEN
jgi:hypothetical protein